MDLKKITPLLITLDEAPNINRTIRRLLWADRIVVVDSYSTDRTLEILKSYPQVEIFQRKFESFAGQCNHGLNQIGSEWVLSLDADYIVPENLIEEIQSLPAHNPLDGYEARFKYFVFGKPLRNTLLPPRKILYRRQKAVYYQDGHAHRVLIDGRTSMLDSFVYHDDRKSFARWVWMQGYYADLEAKKLISIPASNLNFNDKIRRMKLFAPFLIFFYCLIFKGGIFDGWRGLYYAFQRTMAEILLSIRLIEEEKLVRKNRLKQRNGPRPL